MWYNVLATIADKTRDVSVLESALYALLGFAIVFLGIAFLILVVWLVGKGMSKNVGTVQKESKPKAQEVVEIAPKQEAEEIGEVSEETLAIITAAIMAYYEQANVKCEFTVKRIKRI